MSHAVTSEAGDHGSLGMTAAAMVSPCRFVDFLPPNDDSYKATVHFSADCHCLSRMIRLSSREHRMAEKYHTIA
jgi:hypothetical protein